MDCPAGVVGTDYLAEVADMGCLAEVVDMDYLGQAADMGYLGQAVADRECRGGVVADRERLVDMADWGREHPAQVAVDRERLPVQMAVADREHRASAAEEDMKAGSCPVPAALTSGLSLSRQIESLLQALRIHNIPDLSVPCFAVGCRGSGMD